MTDYARRRIMMVDTQVRPADVTRFPIIDAMLDVPREKFVPDALIEAAYAGQNLALGPGRVLLEPRTLAKMLEALNVRPTDLVLDLGAGLGYSTAVLAHLAQAVVGVEPDAAMAAEAIAALSSIAADNAVIEIGALTAGAPGHAPYDVIVVQGGVQTVPDAILAQLAEGGRICALFMEGSLGVVRLGLQTHGRISWRYAFNASAPVLPGFTRATEFSL